MIPGLVVVGPRSRDFCEDFCLLSDSGNLPFPSHRTVLYQARKNCIGLKALEAFRTIHLRAGVQQLWPHVQSTNFFAMDRLGKVPIFRSEPGPEKGGGKLQMAWSIGVACTGKGARQAA